MAAPTPQVHDLHAKFDALVLRIPFSECWAWEGAQTGSGYSVVSMGVSGGVLLAHRVAYERYVGPIPDGLVIDHLCRMRWCVNPAHLRVVTHRKNILAGVGPTARAAARVTCARGHTYTRENTYPRPDGGRACRMCRAVASARYRQRSIGLATMKTRPSQLRGRIGP